MGRRSSATQSDRPAVLFDLDGTLLDSVYQHVLAWKEALEGAGIPLAIWRIHRRIGMSGGLFVRALVRETGQDVTPAEADRLRNLHEEGYKRRLHEVRPLPGAQDLLDTLTDTGVPWAIATSGSEAAAQASLVLLKIPAGVPVITRDQVAYAKPNPDLFLAAAEAALGGKVPVPTPRGEVQLTIPPHSDAGQRLRLRGRGVDGSGDLYVTLTLVAGPVDPALETALREWRERHAGYDPREGLRRRS